VLIAKRDFPRSVRLDALRLDLDRALPSRRPRL